jgi:hypothetical protein
MPRRSTDVDSARWHWSDDLSDLALARAGQITLALFRNADRWIHRRVERVQFRDATSARHRVSVDFTLPADLEPVGDLDGTHVYVAPLFMTAKSHLVRTSSGAYMRKAPYSNLDLVDHAGQSLPLCTRSQTGRVGGAALVTRAQQVLGHDLGDLAERITAIAVRDSPVYAPYLASIFQGSLDDGDPRARLRNDATFKELAHALASHSLVICWFMGEVPPRTIVRLCYDEVMARQRLSLEEALRQRLGWKSALFHVRLNEIGGAASYHVETTVPPELELNETGLFGERYQVGWKGLPPVSSWWKRAVARLRRRRLPLRDAEGYFVRQVGRTRDGHIYIPQPGGRRTGAVWVKLRVRRQDFLAGAVIATIITSAVLGVYALYARKIVVGGAAEAGTTALLLLPALFAAYVARPGEHAITARMLRWPRLALLIDGALPFVAAVRLVTQPLQDSDAARQLQVAWTHLALGSLLFIALFVISSLCPRPHGESQYFVTSTDLVDQ